VLFFARLPGLLTERLTESGGDRIIRAEPTALCRGLDRKEMEVCMVAEMGISMQSIEEVKEMLDHIRFQVRKEAGLLAGLGGEGEIDRLIDTSIAPLVMVAGTGGFDSIEDAISVVGADLRLAFPPSQ
jgi:hypothetical protein